MQRKDFSEFPDKVLRPSVLTSTGVDQQSVSDRTLATRLIGADAMLEALMSGDWRIDTDRQREVFGEFLGRVVANAERQGLEIAEDTASRTDQDRLNAFSVGPYTPIRTSRDQY